MTAEDRKFRPDVEGLRAVAVGLVVLCHAGVPGLEGGYVGVDIFFVLSGFLITGLLVRERADTGSTSMTGFYARRARRILPAASVVLIAAILASYHWLGPLRGATVAEDGKWTALFAANIHLASEGTQYLNVAAPPSPLQHYWSLAVEEQFYLAWPLVFLTAASVAPRANLSRRLAGVLGLVVVVSFTWSVMQTSSDPTWAFFSPLTRAWELGVGALLAVSLSQLRRVPRRLGAGLSWVGLGVVVVSAMLLDSQTRFPGLAAALPVLGTSAVLAAGSIAPRSGAERMLGLPPFQVLGRWSYALYLWHWPVLIIAEERAGHALPAAERLGLVVFGLVLAALTHYIVENPVRYARPLVRSPRASLVTGACLVVAGFGFSASQLRDSGPSRLPAPSAQSAAVDGVPEIRSVERDPVAEVLALVSAAPAIAELPEDLTPDLKRAVNDFAWLTVAGRGCLVDWDIVVSPPCVFGDPEGSRTVMVLGDSHAAMWMGSLDEIGKREDWKVIVLTKTGCPAVSLDLFRPLNLGRNTVIAAYPHCGTWLTNAIDRINETAPDAVVIGSCNGCDSVVDSRGDPIGRGDWAAGLTKTLGRITPTNTVKVVLGDIPRWYGSLDCLALKANVQDCSKPALSATEVTYNSVERNAAETSGAKFVDPTPWFCGAVCTPVVGKEVVYTNDYHVTATYARSLAGALESVLVPLVEVSR